MISALTRNRARYWGYRQGALRPPAAYLDLTLGPTSGAPGLQDFREPSERRRHSAALGRGERAGREGDKAADAHVARTRQRAAADRSGRRRSSTRRGDRERAARDRQRFRRREAVDRVSDVIGKLSREKSIRPQSCRHQSSPFEGSFGSEMPSKWDASDRKSASSRPVG